MEMLTCKYLTKHVYGGIVEHFCQSEKAGYSAETVCARWKHMQSMM